MLPLTLLYKYIYVGLFAFFTKQTQAADTEQTIVEATAPVNPVKVGGILSVHCQITNLPENSVVSIFGTLNGEKEKLAERGFVLQEIEDRVFLSERRMENSMVYFLSITDVTRLDGGDYTCKVTIPHDKQADEVVAVQSVTLEIQHEPSEIYPLCSHNLPKSSNGQITVKSGINVRLNCTSETANPQIDMQWTRTDTRKIPAKPNLIRSGDMTYSILDFQISKEDRAMFICTVTSVAFPDIKNTCHIGPISVISDPNDQQVTKTDFTEPYALTTPHVEINTKSSTDIHQECLKTCQNKSDVFYWIITTTIAATLALIFFTIGMILLIRYHRIQSSVNYYTSPQTFQYPRNPREDTYAELERKQSEKQVYMALELKDHLEHLPATRAVELPARQYTIPMVK